MFELRFTSWRKGPDPAIRTPSLRTAVTLAVTVMMMTFFGMTMLYSTSSGLGAGERLFIRQGLWTLVAVMAAATVYLFGYQRCLAMAYPVAAVSAIMLLVALFFPARKGAHRWIPLIYGASIQPSELAKIAVLLCLAQYSSRVRVGRRFFGGIWTALAATAVVTALVLIGRDLGTTVLLVATVGAMLYAAGVRLRYLMPLPLMAPLLVLCVKWLSPVRWDRFLSFIDPERYQQDISYQLWNSFLALGSGGWFGMGFTESRIKALYLPEAHTDFIVAIIGEELGLVAIICVLLGYATIFVLGIAISVRAAERRGMLLGFGLTLLLTMQAMINLGVVCGALPTKGMPAPFLSYGGSNLVMCFTAIGLLLSIAMEAGANPDESEPTGRQMRLGLGGAKA